MDIFDITQQGIHDLIFLLSGWDCPGSICLYIARTIVWSFVLYGLWLLFDKLYRKPRKEQEEYIRQHVDSGYTEYLSKRARHYYIPARCQSIGPHHYPDILDSIRSAPTENMIDKYVEDIFVTENDGSPLYCVLGGSGMGKTSFLINVLRAYVKKHSVSNIPYDIELINLSNEAFEKKIQAIQSPKTTILLLDALDENPRAISEYDKFIASLEEKIEPFRIVVVTSRTQFFPDEEHELKQSKILNNSKAKGFYAYTRHYVSPFSDNEVEDYLRKRYGLNFRKRRAAKRIVNQCTSFTHRPLLLSYIDDLLSDKRKYETTLDVYEALIEKWLERDTSRTDDPQKTKENLMILLQKAAVKMYENFPIAGYYLDKTAIGELLSDLGLPSLDSIFKGRSLLNRDALGSWKFSHKSFLEFFLAKECFENESFIMDFAGLDVSLALFQDYCKRELDKHLALGKTLLVRSHSMASVFDSLIVDTGSSFNIRYIEPFDSIVTLEIDAKMIDRVEANISRTKLYYVKVNNYLSRISLNGILKYPQIKYITVIGQDCSRSFIKEAKRQGVTVLNNGVLYNFDNNKDSISDAPMDIQSVYYMNIRTVDFGTLFGRH